MQKFRTQPGICTFGRDNKNKMLQKLCEFSGLIRFNVRTILSRWHALYAKRGFFLYCSYLNPKPIRLVVSQKRTSSIEFDESHTLNLFVWK